MSTFIMHQEDLKDAFNRMKSMVSKDDASSVSIFKGIHFIATPKGLLMEATDNYRLCTIAYNLETPPKDYCDFVVEPFTLPKVPNNGLPHPTEVTVNDDTVDFKFPATGDMKTVKQLKGAFPNVATALPDSLPNMQIKLNADYLIDAVKAVKAPHEKKKPITLNIFGDNPPATCVVSCGTHCCMVLPVRSKTPNGQEYDNPLDIIHVSKNIDSESHKAKKNKEDLSNEKYENNSY